VALSKALAACEAADRWAPEAAERWWAAHQPEPSPEPGGTEQRLTVCAIDPKRRLAENEDALER
jgi:hypothetical protein